MKISCHLINYVHVYMVTAIKDICRLFMKSILKKT